MTSTGTTVVIRDYGQDSAPGMGNRFVAYHDGGDQGGAYATLDAAREGIKGAGLTVTEPTWDEAAALDCGDGGEPVLVGR